MLDILESYNYYSGLHFLSSSKKRQGTAVRCNVCGHSRCTLYKDKEGGYICAECRKAFPESEVKRDGE